MEQPAGAALFVFLGRNSTLSRRQRRAVWPTTFPADNFSDSAQHPSEGLSDGAMMCCTSPFYRPKILTAILTTISPAFDDNFDDGHRNAYSILQTFTAKTSDISWNQETLTGTYGNLEEVSITVQISLTPPTKTRVSA